MVITIPFVIRPIHAGACRIHVAVLRGRAMRSTFTPLNSRLFNAELSTFHCLYALLYPRFDTRYRIHGNGTAILAATQKSNVLGPIALCHDV